MYSITSISILNNAWVTSDHKFLFYITGTKPDYYNTCIYWVRIDNLIDRKRSLPD
ncbi:MAG: hypothetical protein WCK84_12630 [Bacteroidota bacterium]